MRFKGILLLFICSLIINANEKELDSAQFYFGKITIMSDFDSVLKYFGQPRRADTISVFDYDDAYKLYYKAINILVVNSYVYNVTSWHPHYYTPDSIHVGDSFEKVLETYGNQFEKLPDNSIAYKIKSEENKKFIFHFKDNKLLRIQLWLYFESFH